MSVIVTVLSVLFSILQILLATILLAAIGFATWYYILLKPSIKLYYSKHLTGIFAFHAQPLTKDSAISSPSSNHSLEQLVREHCPNLKKGFRPCITLPFGHAQTFYNSLYADKRAPHIKYHRETIDYPDGGIASIDWAINPSLHHEIQHEQLPTTIITDKEKALVVLFHGLSGGSQESYIKTMAIELMARHFKVVVLNYRGCAGTKLTSPQLYNGYHTDDMKYFLDEIIFKRFPHISVSAVGCSLGANLLTNYVGREGLQCRLTCAVSLANPFSLDLSSKLLATTIMGRKMYGPAMAFALRKLFSRHKHQFEKSAIQVPKVTHAKTIYDFDTNGTSVIFRYRSADEYYRDASSVRRIPDIRIPTLFLNAADDAIVPVPCLPIGDVESNPFTILAVTPIGGHLGWFGDRKYGVSKQPRWHGAAVADFITMALHVQTVDVQTRYYPSEQDHALPVGPTIYRSALVENPDIEAINQHITEGQDFRPEPAGPAVVVPPAA